MSLKDPGIKGPLWIAKVTMPKPQEDNVWQALATAIDGLKEGGETYTVPQILPVEAEWTGHRNGADKNTTRLNIPEEEQYKKLMADTISDVTVMYMHGGAMIVMDPATTRSIVMNLAKRTGGRCISIRYRLAPQNPFPAALLDCFIAYLSLLSPPPGSFHDPVPAEKIVFAGESAGGNLSLVLVQLILQLHRTFTTGTPTVLFNGKEVPVPLPAGIATNSAWTDVVRCMPSLWTNAKYDFLPAPSEKNSHDSFPKCEKWPADPPRLDFYADTSALQHPLVSPLAAKDWIGAPPTYFVYGSECLTDEGKIVARRMASQGVKVHWYEYEAMPHCFAVLLVSMEGSKKCMNEWGDFIKAAVLGQVKDVQGHFVQAKTLKDLTVDPLTLLDEFSYEQVESKMKNRVKQRAEGKRDDERLMAKL